jgi:two-component sensor histidine kinase
MLSESWHLSGLAHDILLVAVGAGCGMLGRDRFGEVFGLLGSYEDISDRKQSEELLRRSLLEKELLLKEVHHRVKNNLQVISSIFSLQSNYVDDPQILAILEESQNRITSMALIHEKLYQSDSLANIDFADYLSNLTSSLFSSYNVNHNEIHLNLNVSNVSLNIDTAIPCGLLINEMVSNSLKHAFPAGRSGGIWIDLSVTIDQHLRLTIRDNGVGLPANFNIKTVNTLGLSLVEALVHQLEGELSIYSDNGATFELVFPQPKEYKGYRYSSSTGMI